MLKKYLYPLFFIFILVSCDNPKEETRIENTEKIENPTNKVLLSSDVVWEKLNPARGDQSPQAGTLWGDRNGSEATGFLAKFVDGFSSPPHIHNVTYRAVVIKGLVHNDDPNATNMWMPSGSFWTQPVGESHITSAKGGENIALVEIDNGPYLVKPVDEAYDSGERPVNVDASNVVWLDENKTKWVRPGSGATLSFLWEGKKNKASKGMFVKLPAGFKGTIASTGTVFRAVVIQGEINYDMPKSEEVKVLDSGSYFSSTSKAVHEVSNNSESETVIYVRTNGEILIGKDV